MFRVSWGNEPLEITEKEEEKEKRKDKTQEETVKELAKCELEQRKKKGDEEVFEELSNYWQKLRINQVEEEWKADKFSECHTTHGMVEGVSKGAEREPELAQHKAHVEEQRETQFPGKHNANDGKRHR